MSQPLTPTEPAPPVGFAVRGAFAAPSPLRRDLFPGPGDPPRDVVAAALASGALRLTWRPCPLCDGRSFERLVGEERHGLPHATVLCESCGFCLTNPTLDDESTAAFYAAFYRSLYASGTSLDRFFTQQAKKGRTLRGFLAKIGFEGPFRRVVEVGAGAGGVLHAFKAAGADTYGVDFDEDYLAYGRKRGMTLAAGGVAAIPDEPSPDLVIYRHVLEHIANPVAELAVVFGRWPKALVLIEVPGLLNLRFYGFEFGLYLQNAHTSNFTADTLRRAVARAGGRALHADETVRCVATAGAEPEGSDRALQETSAEAATPEPRVGDVKAYLALCAALADSPWLRESLPELTADPRFL